MKEDVQQFIPAYKELRKRSIAKTISWRTVGSLDTMLISFVVFAIFHVHGTLDVAKAASLVGLCEVPNKLLLYYLHERVWSRIKWGRRVEEPDYLI
jgi:uncharacterized membrane protein